MAKPESAGSGVLLISHETFYKWASTFLPEPAFYTFGKLKDKTDSIEIPWSMSTETTPPPPA